jgi:hypothetical protein
MGEVYRAQERRLDREAAAVFQLRCFAGIGVGEAANNTGLSPRTAACLWSHARVALHRDLAPDP